MIRIAHGLAGEVNCIKPQSSTLPLISAHGRPPSGGVDPALMS